MDFTMVTHEKACKSIRKEAVLQIIVYRKGGREIYEPKHSNQHSIMYQGYGPAHNNNAYGVPHPSFNTAEKF